jgi:hypothetical protein
MRRLVILIVFLTALALPAQVLAAGVPHGAAGVHQYHRVIPGVAGEEPLPFQPATGGPGALPFTGEDVLLVVLAGLLLTGGGLTLYRQARQR